MKAMQSLQSRAQKSFLRSERISVILFGWTYCFRKETKMGYQKKKLSPLMRQYIRQSKLSTTKAEEANKEFVPKTARTLPYME